MPIRALTDVELEQIKTAKQNANNKLKELRENLKRQRRTMLQRELEKQLRRLSSPTGKPVVVVRDDREIVLDYELLKRFTKTLDRGRFMYSFRIDGRDIERKLTVHYHSVYSGGIVGSAEIFEILYRLRELLHGLPKVELG